MQEVEFKPQWERVCKEPETCGGLMWLKFDHSHDYWCKFCNQGIVTEDDRQIRLRME